MALAVSFSVVLKGLGLLVTAILSLCAALTLLRHRAESRYLSRNFLLSEILSCYLSRSVFSVYSHLLELLFGCNMARGTPAVYMVTRPLTRLTWLTV